MTDCPKQAKVHLLLVSAKIHLVLAHGGGWHMVVARTWWSPAHAHRPHVVVARTWWGMMTTTAPAELAIMFVVRSTCSACARRAVRALDVQCVRSTCSVCARRAVCVLDVQCVRPTCSACARRAVHALRVQCVCSATLPTFVAGPRRSAEVPARVHDDSCVSRRCM